MRDEPDATRERRRRALQRADARRVRTREALVELDGRYTRVAVAAALEAVATGRRARRRSA